jgi:hypothetical protein
VGVVVIMLMSSTPAAAATTHVPPKQYINSVCHALALFQSATSASPISASQKYKDAPSQDTAVTLRQAILDELDGLDGLVASLVHRMVAAGVPDVANGEQFAAAVVDQQQRIATIKLALRPQAEAIDVSSSCSFATTVQGAATALDDAFGATKQPARKLAVVKQAPAVLHPLAAYLMTPKASNCSSK